MKGLYAERLKVIFFAKMFWFGVPKFGVDLGAQQIYLGSACIMFAGNSGEFVVMAENWRLVTHLRCSDCYLNLKTSGRTADDEVLFQENEPRTMIRHMPSERSLQWVWL